jgi:hypothetical protein
MIELMLKSVTAFREAAMSEVRAAFDDHSGWLAARVGVNHLNFHDRIIVNSILNFVIALSA